MEQNYICCFGETLWDDFPTGRVPGGAPMNVAIGLQNLGLDSKIISRVGDDALGKDLIAFLESKKCTTDWIQIDTNHETGIVKVMASPSGENHYEIVAPTAWDFINYTDELAALVEQSYALVFGTLSCRQENNRQTLLKLVKVASLRVYDVNFRPPFYDKNLVKLLLNHSDIVKMNDEELAIIASWYGIKSDNEQEVLGFLKEKFGLITLIVTKGANGAICLDETGFYQSEGVKVTVQDTVGSGDAFLAGFLKTNFYEHQSTEKSLKFACAIGAFVASQKGANPNFDSFRPPINGYHFN